MAFSQEQIFPYLKNIYSIIVTYNGGRWIEKCLNSLIGSSYPTKIIVVDNGSKDSTVSLVRSKYPSVQLIETGKNAGFGQATNIGLDIAIKNAADYVFLLNQDAWVQPDCLQLLVESHLSKPAFGIVSPVHLNGTGSGLDRYFMDYFLESSSREYISLKILDQHLPGATELINTQFVNAAAWLISAECLLKTGGFDPIFFHYGEDRDLAQRAIYWGFRVGIHPMARIFHDRDDRTTKLVEDSTISNRREWIHFLNQACNIHNPEYKMLIVRRFCRYFALMCVSALKWNRKEIKLHSFMVRNIAISFPNIRACRKRSMAFGIARVDNREPA